MGLYVLRRPPRPQPRIAAPEPLPEPPRGFDPLSEPSVMQSVLPVLGGVGFVLFMLIRPSPVYVAIGILWLLLLVGGGIGMALNQRRVRRRRLERTRRAYLAALDRARARTRERLVAESDWTARANPPPADLAAVALSAQRVWERRRDDPDALAVRVGVRDVENPAAVGPAGEPPPLDVDPVCEDALGRLREAVGVVENAPALLPLRELGRVHLRGDVGRARSMARAVMAQLVTWHAPTDVRVVVCCRPEHTRRWAWVRWLPHARWTEETPGLGAPILTAPGALDGLLDGLVAARRAAGGGHLGAHVVVVADGVDVDEEGGRAGMVALHPELRITVLDLADVRPVDATVSLTLTVHDDGRVLATHGGHPPELVASAADRIGLGDAEVLSRLLSPWRLPGHSLAGAAAADTADLPTLLGVQDVEQVTARTGWRSRPYAERLAVPIGVSPDGEPVVLDLKEAAAGGMGPHGLIVGATGSGKSELLRTLVLGLAATHPPEDLAFVLVDFKGGAAFAGLSELPHVAGTVTNLAGDTAMVLRARDAVQGELLRRQQLLADTGGLDGVRDYQRLRATSRPELPPLPTLLVVIDEFAELLTEHPDIAELLAAIGRVGRSIGIHLLLASQRFEGGGVRGLDSHLSYRIALRTFTESDSQSVIGSKAAATLPAPGAAILRHGGADRRLQVLHVGGPVPRRATSGPAAEPVQLLRAWHDGLLDTLIDELHAAPGRHTMHEPVPSRPEPTLLDTVVAALRADDRRARPVWLDPLPTRVALSALLPDVAQSPRGLGDPSGRYGAGRVPLGVADRPLRQSMVPLVLDLFGRESSLLVHGAPQSGKSTLLATLTLALALTHTPGELQVYVVDLGGGSLAALRGLPHVGGVASRSEPERVLRTLRRTVALVDDRELLFREHGLGSIAEFRARVAAGALGRVRAADVVLLVDGAADLRKLSDDADDMLVDLARRGPGMGVHLVLTASRSGDLRPALRDSLSSAVELRLGDPNDSVIDRKAARNVSAGVAGRGLSPDALVHQVALPVLTMPGSGTLSLADVVGRVRAAWTGPCAPPVPVLPERYGRDELPVLDPVRDGLLLGVEEEELAPIAVDLVRAGPHLVVLGDGESGRSSLLRHLLAGLAGAPGEDRPEVYVADPRLTLLDTVAQDRLAGYAASGPACAQLCEKIAGALAGREPDASVTPRELRTRSWWKGPEIYLLIDDYDVLLGSAPIHSAADHPLGPLLPVVSRGAELGLHVIMSARIRGSSTVLRDAVFGGAVQRGCPGLLMSGDRSEGPVLQSHRPRLLPPGRGLLVRNRRDPVLVQSPWCPPADEAP